MITAIKTYLTKTAIKAKRYAIIASVSLNVMLAVGIIGYAYCAGNGYVHLPSIQAPAADPDIEAYNTANQALSVSTHSLQPPKQPQRLAKAEEVAPRPVEKPTSIPPKAQQ